MPGHRNRRGGFGGFGWWIGAFSLLLIAEKPRHGYEIASELRELGFPIIGVGQMGSIYRTLSSMEASGLITAFWDTKFSPPRKVYRITPLGYEYLNEIELEISTLKTLADAFVEKMEELKKNEKFQESQ